MTSVCDCSTWASSGYEAASRLAIPCIHAILMQFVDALKSRLVPAHLRPPLGALNWIPPTGDSDVDGQMVARMEQALGVVQDVLEVLRSKIAEQGAEALVSPLCSRFPVGWWLSRVNRCRTARMGVRVVVMALIRMEACWWMSLHGAVSLLWAPCHSPNMVLNKELMLSCLELPLAPIELR